MTNPGNVAARIAYDDRELRGMGELKSQRRNRKWTHMRSVLGARLRGDDRRISIRSFLRTTTPSRRRQGAVRRALSICCHSPSKTGVNALMAWVPAP
jgi:hypothetical protein